MNNQFQKIITLLLGLFLILIFSYNQKREVRADEIPLTICQQVSEGSTVNNLEIPIGRATDQAQALASQVFNKAGKILDTLKTAKPIDINASCKLDNCSPQCIKAIEEQTCITGQQECRLSSQVCIASWDTCGRIGMVPYDNCRDSCPPGSPVCCHKPETSCRDEWIEAGDCGPACGEFDKCCNKSITCPDEWEEYDNCQPLCPNSFDKCCQKPEKCEENGPCYGNACSSELITELNNIINRADITNQKIQEIKTIMKEEPKKIEQKIAMSRKRLRECSLASTAGEALESEGDETILKEYTILLDCFNVVETGIEIYSVLDGTLQQGCYGRKYCERTGISEPCAEDYFCCQ